MSLVRFATALVAAGAMLTVAACGSSRSTIEKDQATAEVGTYPPGPANAPKPKIGAPPFKVTTSSGSARMGEEAADQLTTLLVGADRFTVIERAQMDQLLNEQGLQGVVKSGEMAKPGQVNGVDYLMYGKVTNFRVQAEHSSGGFGLAQLGLPGGGGIGAFDYKNKNATVKVECGVDLRLVNPTTGEVIAAKSADYNRTDTVSGFGIQILGNNAHSDADLKVDQDNEGKILRLALDEALRKMLPDIDRKVLKPAAK